ncbi:MAG: rhomboid family intramembrane serine protease [Planctomycetota bacterium]
MRQIGSLSTERDARRFIAFLISKSIAAEADSVGNDSWVIWVRDEDFVAEARSDLEVYQRESADRRYDEAVAIAAQKLLEADRQRREAASRTIEGSVVWNRTVRRRQPLVTAISILCVVIFVWLEINSQQTSWLNDLLFSPVNPKMPRGNEGWSPILHGEFWRLVTPAFLHFSLSHLIFNLLSFRYLGNLVESIIGTPRTGILLLLCTLVANIAQYTWAQSSVFGGISGTIFGIFGFAWMMSIYRPSAGIVLSPEAVAITMIFFFLCLLRDVPNIGEAIAQILPPIANANHVGGLAAGIMSGLAFAKLTKQR